MYVRTNAENKYSLNSLHFGVVETTTTASVLIRNAFNAFKLNVYEFIFLVILFVRCFAYVSRSAHRTHTQMVFRNERTNLVRSKQLGWCADQRNSLVHFCVFFRFIRLSFCWLRLFWLHFMHVCYLFRVYPVNTCIKLITTDRL